MLWFVPRLGAALIKDGVIMTIGIFSAARAARAAVAVRGEGAAPSVERLTGQDMQALKDRAKALFIIDVVSHATGIPAAEILSSSRNHAGAARARQVAMYLAYITYQWPLARIGAAFKRDRTTAGHACRLIEDLRDDRRFDLELDKLEACLKNAPEPLAIVC
jgi:chromosomal replication initiation ATPase DnaA